MSEEVEIIAEENFRMKGKVGNLSQPFYVDLVKKYGGQEEYPSPTNLLAGALGACIIAVMSLRAKRLGISIVGTSLKVRTEFTPAHQVNKFVLEIHCPTPVDKNTSEELEKAANQCPVHCSIDHKIPQEMEFHWQFK